MYLLTQGGDQITRAGGLGNPSSGNFPTIIHSWLRKGTWEALSYTLFLPISIQYIVMHIGVQNNVNMQPIGTNAIFG